VLRAGDAEPETVVALRLRLALAQEHRKARREEREMQERQWQIEKEKLTMQNDGQLTTQNAMNVELKDVNPCFQSWTMRMCCLFHEF